MVGRSARCLSRAVAVLLLGLAAVPAAASERGPLARITADPLVGGRHLVLHDFASAREWDRVRRFMLHRRNRYHAALRPLFLWAVALRREPVEARLLAIHRRVNDEFAYASDVETWGRGDYWATPLENLVKRRMDCEDFASLKLYLAGIAGVDPAAMALLVGRIVSTGESHVVLLARVKGRGYVLDNRLPQLVDSERYTDFELLYSVDLEHVRIYRDRPAEPAAPGTGPGR